MDQAAIVRDYKELRRVSRAVNDRLAKTLSRDQIQAAAKALGMLRDKTIVLETEDEIGVMMDYAIHNVFRDGRNAVDRLLEDDPPPEGSDELRMLRSMQKSHYTVFEVQSAIPGLGVRGLDAWKQPPVLIVDMGFSRTAVAGMALAARIFSPGDEWWMTTGAALPLNGKALDRIIREFKDYVGRHGDEPSDQARTTMIIRACIESGASQQISYAAPGQDIHPRSVPVVRGSKVGRNDPCPCGSGKKYKKCCGM